MVEYTAIVEDCALEYVMKKWKETDGKIVSLQRDMDLTKLLLVQPLFYVKVKGKKIPTGEATLKIIKPKTVFFMQIVKPKVISFELTGKV